MDKKLKVWKTLGIVFTALASICFLVTIIMTTLYVVSGQTFHQWTVTNSIQDKTIANKKKDIKRFKRLEQQRNDYYYDYDDSTYDDVKPSSHIFGESAKLDTGEEITVTGVQDSGSLKIKGKSERKIVLIASVKNTTKKPIQFSPEDFFIYDNHYNIASVYQDAHNKTIPSTILPGQTIDAKIHFTIPEDSPYMVTFGEAYWLPQTNTQKNSRSV